MCTSKFPDSQKVARVKPLFKNCSKFDTNNYRPISILTAISKICEEVLAQQLRLHFEMINLFYDNHCGFRDGKSTCFAISKLKENLYDNFNRSEIKEFGPRKIIIVE